MNQSETAFAFAKARMMDILALLPKMNDDQRLVIAFMLDDAVCNGCGAEHSPANRCHCWDDA